MDQNHYLSNKISEYTISQYENENDAKNYIEHLINGVMSNKSRNINNTYDEEFLIEILKDYVNNYNKYIEKFFISIHYVEKNYTFSDIKLAHIPFFDFNDIHLPINIKDNDKIKKIIEKIICFDYAKRLYNYDDSDDSDDSDEDSEVQKMIEKNIYKILKFNKICKEIKEGKYRIFNKKIFIMGHHKPKKQLINNNLLNINVARQNNNHFSKKNRIIPTIPPISTKKNKVKEEINIIKKTENQKIPNICKNKGKNYNNKTEKKIENEKKDIPKIQKNNFFNPNSKINNNINNHQIVIPVISTANKIEESNVIKKTNNQIDKIPSIYKNKNENHNKSNNNNNNNISEIPNLFKYKEIALNNNKIEKTVEKSKKEDVIQKNNFFNPNSKINNNINNCQTINKREKSILDKYNKQNEEHTKTKSKFNEILNTLDRIEKKKNSKTTEQNNLFN